MIQAKMVAVGSKLPCLVLPTFLPWWSFIGSTCTKWTGTAVRTADFTKWAWFLTSVCAESANHDAVKFYSTPSAQSGRARHKLCCSDTLIDRYLCPRECEVGNKYASSCFSRPYRGTYSPENRNGNSALATLHHAYSQAASGNRGSLYEQPKIV